MSFALDLHLARLHLLVASHPQVDHLTDELIARLALAGRVYVLDGGNRFDLHRIARSIRSQTVALDAALKRILVARAFTCFQIATLLASQAPGDAPLLILHLLSTFGDENVPRSQRLHLLDECLGNLKRLSAYTPLLVTAFPTSEWLPHLEPAAAHTWRFEPVSHCLQPRLF